jgi:hypothetical protein
LAAAEFDVFLTVDRNLSYQQDVSAFDIAVVVLVARSNSIDDLRPLGLEFWRLLPTHSAVGSRSLAADSVPGGLESVVPLMRTHSMKVSGIFTCARLHAAGTDSARLS